MTPMNLFSHRLFRNLALASVAVGLVAAAHVTVRTAGQKFYSDDPLTKVPESADASKAQPWDIDLFYDLSYNLFVTPRNEPTRPRAGNVNTIDEVPDSSWFTNRVGARTLTADELAKGPVEGPAPDPASWTITREKSAGAAAGFTAKDAGGHTWFVSFDAPANPQGATAAVVVATKIFWALGYNQVEYFLTDLSPEKVRIDPNATRKRPSGDRTPMTEKDVREILELANRNPDGSYRAAAGRLLPGKVLGGFKYQGTRPDDPNDVVPHEHRRELRALRVFGAWTNLTDMKAGNTLDTIIDQGGRGVIRHYLQDVGSTFGVGANGPHDWNEGWEFLYDGGPSRKRFFTFGFGLSPWQTAYYEDHPAIGRFEGDAFDPETWKPRVPTAAYFEMRDDDAFWAARRVMAFTNDMIKAIVKVGRYSDPKAEQYLADVLIKRRDKIGQAYLTKINPVVDPALDGAGVLTFGNAAAQYRLREPGARVLGHVVLVRQRHGRVQARRRDHEHRGADAETGGGSRRPRDVSPRRHRGGSPAAPELEAARPGVLPAPGGWLEAGRTRPAGRAARGGRAIEEVRTGAGARHASPLRCLLPMAYGLLDTSCWSPPGLDATSPRRPGL